MANPRPLNRSELAKFLPDQRAVRAFEQLFDLIPEELLTLLAEVNEAKLSAGNATSSANEALAQLTRMADALDILAKAPPAQKDTFLKGDYIDFPINGPHIPKERRVQWNDDDGTMDVGLYNGSVLQIGQESMYYAKNTSGAQIDNGTPVMFTGTVGSSGKLTFGLAVADGSVPADFMMGVSTQDIANNDFGYVTSFGLVRGLRTDGVPYGETWNDGDLLYFDPTTAGAWTNVKPQAPNIVKSVAVVINATSGSSGSIFVRMDIGESLATLQDASITSVANNDMMVYVSSNNRWENKTASATRTSLGLGTMALQNTGATGTFTTTDGKTVTVTNGVITNIV